MTVREHINSRRQWLAAIGLASLGVGVFGVLLAVWSVALGVPVIVLGFGGVGLCILFWCLCLRCPKCYANLGLLQQSAWDACSECRPVSFCPCCGLSLDAEFEAT